MEILASLIGAPVNALTLIIAVGILVFLLADRGLLKIGKNGKTEGNRIDRLANYYNHDLTEKLDRLLSMEEKEHEAAQQTRDALVKVTLILEALQRDGVRCRKD